ncbi:hypothetical protein [Sinomonas humi]|uniref:Uncharacterized protein n=1 Tax=Sinomonas humi TaxID=1338436 RepID=A0A0B2APC0_9MICC|nr:hypothetical protein [Sinomonas humi]KHL03797.1 hypothetical protein LK10_08385 [Sinomonas humi]
MEYTLASVVDATAEARYATPAQFDHALAAGVNHAEARLMLVSGATYLAATEHRDGHPEGVIGVTIDRREAILESVLAELPLRRLAALAVEFEVIHHGDDETPAAVVYAATRSTGADWADELLGWN